MILDQWFNGLDVDIRFENVSDTINPDNKPLRISDIKNHLPSLKDKIGDTENVKLIAIGKTAAKALTLLRLDFLEMPHPSGCNRLLNNREYVSLKVQELRDFLAS